MSRSVNKVTLIGNLGADPEIRSTSGGNKVANFSVATSRQWTSAAGEKQEKTEWHKCVAWNGSRGTGLADVLERYVKKGDKVYLEGRIEYRSYEDKEQQTRWTTEINVTEILMLGGKLSDDAKKEPAQSTQKLAGTDGFEEMPGGDDDLPF